MYVHHLSELVPNPGVPNFFTPLPFGLGGLQMCPDPKGEDFVKATYDIDFADSAWAQLGYASIFMGAFLFFAVRALANIDHSSLAAIQVPSLFRRLLPSPIKLMYLSSHLCTAR